MKPKEIQELKNKPVPELQKLLKESRERLRLLKFDLAAGKVKDVSELRSLRKDIARIMTFMRVHRNKEMN
jgi:ribosomal protein L29